MGQAHVGSIARSGATRLAVDGCTVLPSEANVFRSQLSSPIEQQRLPITVQGRVLR